MRPVVCPQFLRRLLALTLASKRRHVKVIEIVYLLSVIFSLIE